MYRICSPARGSIFCVLSPAGHSTILNALRVALRIISGKYIFKFAILENLRIFQNCLFTGGVWARTLLRHLALLDASSPEGGAFCALSPAGRGTILNGLRCALAMFSGKIILNFRVCRTLRSATDAFFTGGVVAGNCICSACFLRKCGAAAEHPFRLLTAFAATFPKGTALGGDEKVCGSA